MARRHTAAMLEATTVCRARGTRRGGGDVDAVIGGEVCDDVVDDDDEEEEMGG